MIHKTGEKIMTEMSAKSHFAHVGMTVKSVDVTEDFYKQYFGFDLKERGEFQ